MTFEELAAALALPTQQLPQLQKTLQAMEATGEVVRTRLERFGAPDRMNLAVGRLQGHPKGFGFLVRDAAGEDDVFIGRESLNGAWHGDRIIARLSPPSRAGGRVEGEVIRILQRANQRVVGTFEAARHAGYVTPDDRRLPDDIFIPKGMTNGARSGEKVVVQVVEFPEARRNAEGRVVERLGLKGDAGVDIVSVIRKHGLPEVFPPKVLKESEAVPETVSDEAATEEGRRDLRKWTIVTIDGEDAKDLDDAISLERTGEQTWRLGVHIADVAYYVPEGSALDQEAFRRGTSVYLADRVVPMLPPRLSNGICSLNPNVDRLTLSCVMEINGEGKVQSYEIFPSVIRTAARMTYSRVNAILDGDSEAQAEYKPLLPLFREMAALMAVLREKRVRRGSLDFDLPEAKVRLSPEGWPLEIVRVQRGLAERVIEEFMLIANETVAEHCHKRKVPFMFRVHADPAPDKIGALREFLQLFGFSLKLGPNEQVKPKVLQSVTDWVRGRREENLINSVVLRSMRQAVYSERNDGHFGLAADYYCHFTSPIRRYPDLVVHRVLRAMLAPGGISKKLKEKWERWMPEAARTSSERERLAVEAERETMEIKKAEFMSDKVGQSFEGIVSGVSQFGFFVQLTNTVEGLVHVSTLTDDYYHFQDKYYALVGERTRRRFRLGDPVVVQLTRVDVESRQVDFMLDSDLTAVETVDPVEAETRSRADHKAVQADPQPREKIAAPQPQKAGEVPEKTGRKRKRRRGKAGKAGPVEAAEMVEEEPAATAPAPTAAPPTPVPVAAADKPAEKPPARAQKPAARAEQPKEQPREKPKPARARMQSEPRRVNQDPQIERPAQVSGRVDMWGLPVPSHRAVRRDEGNDPGVINPFSIQPPTGGRGRGRPQPEAPFTPAPGTEDEMSGLPGLADGSSPRRGPARGRRSSGRKRPEGQA